MFNPSKHLRQFGIGVFLIAAFSRVLSALHLRKFFCAYTNWKHKYLSNWLWKRFAYTVKYDKDTKHEVEDDGYVFVFWYQGVQSAPPVVKACIASVKKWCVNRKVVVLDKGNFREYANMPDCWQRVQAQLQLQAVTTAPRSGRWRRTSRQKQV